MENNDIIEMKKVSDDDLLALYSEIENHLKYLDENIIELEEEGEEENE